MSFTLRPGEVLALGGESGCGKSATALSLIGLIGLLARNAKASGRIEFDATDLLGLPEKAWEDLRGGIAMIFQDPMTALDPLYRVGEQIAEVLRRTGRSAQIAAARAVELLARSGARTGTARAGLSASAVGRHAPARDDRHGAGLRTQAADRGRADDRAGRDRAGADL
ncbi:ATP-binding cassette domain-containing protein [Paracoccus mutanolyticus]|uniref:ATP-binding cassette domain-containing protein n=1 Tax=Paracoccus mutanolyticus TaxID=1499308 RepID=UPI0021D51CBA|nr:ATP-binding cassette domain-containing protein [Paracoccus mutanolyticus]